MFSVNRILGSDFSTIAAGLDGLAQRQRVHAENLANVDTEGYTARTVDFEQQLKAARRSDDAGDALARLSDDSGGVDGFDSASDASDGADLDAATDPASTSTARDGADSLVPGREFRVSDSGKAVNRTSEAAAMMNDNIRFRVLTQQANNRISSLRSVLNEMGRG